MSGAKRCAAALFLCFFLAAMVGCNPRNNPPPPLSHSEMMAYAAETLPGRYNFSFYPVTLSEHLTVEWQPAIPDIPLKKTPPLPPPTAYTGGITPYYDWELSGQVLAIINQYRAEAGLAALGWHVSLAETAAIRAREIVSYYSHTRPNGTEFQTAIASLTDYERVGENLCYGYSTAEAIMDAFMNSDSHRAAILGDFTHVGVGIYRASNGRYYCGQIFGKIRAA